MLIKDAVGNDGISLVQRKACLNKTPVLIFQLKGGGERRGEGFATLGAYANSHKKKCSVK